MAGQVAEDEGGPLGTVLLLTSTCPPRSNLCLPPQKVDPLGKGHVWESLERTNHRKAPVDGPPLPHTPSVGHQERERERERPDCGLAVVCSR